MAVAVLIGTRPELIKMAPVIKKLLFWHIPFIFIHSGQHYSREMDRQIMTDLGMPKPDYNLHVGSGTHAVQTGKILAGVEEICLKKRPDVVVVHGDTNTTLSGALAAKKLHIPVAHIEAGLRSFDYAMPEEINRIIVDRISDILFAPTKEAQENLLKEGLDSKAIRVTGNTIVDALKENLSLANKSKILKRLSLVAGGYILLTAHRPENVDQKETLIKLLECIDYISRKLNKNILWPIHPRTQNKLENFNLTIPNSVITISPVGYIDMLALINNSALVLTDSGGIQEEAYILKKSLITLRNSTERPETLSANFIVHLSKSKIDKALSSIEKRKITWTNSFGNGKASDIIVKALKKYVKR